LRYFAFAAGLFLAAWVAQKVLAPFVIAFLIAYALEPFLFRLEARKVPRTLGIVAILAVALGAAGGAFLLLWPVLESDAVTVMNEMPGYAHALAERMKRQSIWLLFQKRLDRGSKGVQFILDDVPYKFSVDSEIIVHENMSHTDDSRPWDFRNTVSCFVR